MNWCKYIGRGGFEMHEKYFQWSPRQIHWIYIIYYWYPCHIKGVGVGGDQFMGGNHQKTKQFHAHK